MKRAFVRLSFCISLCFVTINTNAQSDSSKGIKWITGLSWEGVKQKAKQHNKYIFIDGYTTWCGPCKAMEKKIYINDSISSFFNKHFISIKLQIDRTKSDNEYVKSWYKTSDSLVKALRITAYPTLIFLSPENKIVAKEEGYLEVNPLLTFAKKALDTKTLFKDPYLEYDSLIAAYKKGKYDFSIMPYLIESAIKLNDSENVKSLGLLYYNFLLEQRDRGLLDKKNIEFIAKHYISSSRSKFFSLFYRNSARVDAIMTNPGYSKRIVDNIIQKEDVRPFIKLSPNLVQNGLTASPSTPNWMALFDTISKKYNSEFADRNVLQAKIIWYRYYKDWDIWASCFIERYTKYGVDTLSWDHIPFLNDAAWAIFNEISDSKKLGKAIDWIQEVLRRLPKYDSPYYEVMVGDTYANLLYKIGVKQEAIRQEEKVIALLKTLQIDNNLKQEILSCFQKMMRGEPTWKPGSYF